MGIDAEKWPARKTSFHTTFQPGHRFLTLSQRAIYAGDLIVGVVRMAEGTWEIECSANTLQGRAGLIAPGVQHSLKTDNQGFVRHLFQSRRQPLLSQIQMPRQERSIRVSMEGIHVSGSFSKPEVRNFFRASEVAAVNVEILEVTAPRLWIRPARVLVGDAPLLQPSDMHTNRCHPVMGPLKIRLCCQYLLQRRDGVSVLEIFRWTPQNPSPGKMSLWQCRVEFQGLLTMVFRLLHPSALRVEAEVHVC